MNARQDSRSAKRVLIVDDDRDFSAAIGEILDSEGYEVRLAHNAADAIAILQGYKANVALLDIRLGRDSGIELISELQRIRGDILCVMMTGHAALETAIQALQHGAYNYLRKPVDGTDLLATLERCFERMLLQEDKVYAESKLSARNRELETFTVRLRNIVESIRRLTASGDLQQLLPLMLREVSGNIGASRGSLFYVTRGETVFFHGASLDTQTQSRPPTVNNVIMEALARKRKPLLIGNASSAPELLTEGWGSTAPESLLILPLFGESDAIAGVLTLHRGAEQPFSDQDSELASLLSSVCSEIVRSAEASEAVAAGERRYRILADNVADIIWTIDMMGTPTYISPSVLPMRGYSPEEAMAQSLEERMSAESAALVRTLLSRVRKSPAKSAHQLAQNMELELRRKDGSFVTTETQFTVLTDPSDAVVGLLGVSRDLSERRRAEDARSRLAAAVEHAAESIMITDPDGMIQYVNPAFEKLSGYTQAEAIGSTPRIFQSGGQHDGIYERLRETLEKGDVWTGRFVDQTKSGRQTEQEATVSAIRDGRGKTISYVSVARDVTHEVELERKLRQSQKMEAIGTLAGGIAHDFNNMLSPILGYAELAMADVDPGSELYFSLSEIAHAGRRASELVQQILAFSRRSEHERIPIRLSTILKEALRLLRGSLPSTIYIRQEIANCPPVLADSTEIHQVIMNLCTNAYHAMRERGGTLTVSLSHTYLHDGPDAQRLSLAEGGYVQLRIADTGHGMDAQTQERIFEPYFTTKSTGEGTGLGLATVHGIVESHQGRIFVSSEVHRGTVFTIYLPAAPADATVECDAEEPDDTRWTGNERIIVVDDEDAIVAMLKRGLGALGYRVDGFSNGADALAAFTARPDEYDLLITDQTMPRLTGLELARQAIGIRPGFPVILATGFSDTVNEQIARKAGIREFLLKPTSPRAIAEHVRRILDETDAVSPG